MADYRLPGASHGVLSLCRMQGERRTVSRLKAMFQGALRRNIEDFERARHKDDGTGTADGAPTAGGRGDRSGAADLPTSAPGSQVQHDASLSHVHSPFGYIKELFTRFS